MLCHLHGTVVSEVIHEPWIQWSKGVTDGISVVGGGRPHTISRIRVEFEQ